MCLSFFLSFLILVWMDHDTNFASVNTPTFGVVPNWKNLAFVFSFLWAWHEHLCFDTVIYNTTWEDWIPLSHFISYNALVWRSVDVYMEGSICVLGNYILRTESCHCGESSAEHTTSIPQPFYIPITHWSALAFLTLRTVASYPTLSFWPYQEWRLWPPWTSWILLPETRTS